MENQVFPITDGEAKKAGLKRHSASNRDAQFPTRLRNLRNEAGFSQAMLAEMLGVTKSTISLWEQGDTTPDVKAISIMAEKYNVSCDYILCRSDVKSSETRISDINKYTGLSETIIELLRNDTGDTRTFLRTFLGMLERHSTYGFLKRVNSIYGLAGTLKAQGYVIEAVETGVSFPDEFWKALSIGYSEDLYSSVEMMNQLLDTTQALLDVEVFHCMREFQDFLYAVIDMGKQDYLRKIKKAEQIYKPIKKGGTNRDKIKQP